MPVFGYGCAVFMQSDIVNFQRQGWRAEEILAGLAAVLPKNIFLYVARFRIWPRSDRASCCRAARRTIWRPSKREVDFIDSQLPSGQAASPKLSCTSIAANPAPSARRVEASRLCRERPRDQLHRPGRRAQHQLQAPRATKTRAATSARTIACAPSSTSIPAIVRTSSYHIDRRSSRPRFRCKPASSA